MAMKSKTCEFYFHITQLNVQKKSVQFLIHKNPE